MTLQDLTAYVVNYMKRADLGSQVAQFVVLAEARINAILRTPAQVKREVIDTATAVPVAPGAYDLPTDYLEMRSVHYGSGSERVNLAYVSLEEIGRYTGSGNPGFYTMYDGVIEFAPGPGERPIYLTYYAKVDPLILPTDTNPVLNEYPQIYLGGVLAEAHRSVQDFEAAKGEADERDREINRANNAATASMVGTSPRMAQGAFLSKPKRFN